MFTRRVISASLLLAVASTSVRAALPLIYCNTSNLLPNTLNQTLQIYVTGTDTIEGENLNFQINSGSSGPVFIGVNIISSTIFGSNNTGQTHPFDPASTSFNSQGIYIASGTLSGHLAVVTTTTNSGTVTDNGLLATLTISTTATTGSAFVLNMLNTLNGTSNFVTAGSTNILPSYPHMQFSIATSPDRQWNINGGGSWGTDSNWTLFAPYARGDIADFTGALTSGTATVTLDGIRTAGTVNFNDTAGSYDLQAGAAGTLLLDNGSQAALIACLAGKHSISAPTVLSGATTVSVASGSTLTLSGGISGASSLSLVGSGKMILTGSANSYGATNVAAGSNLQVGNGIVSGSFGTAAINNSGTVTLANLAQPLSTPLSGSGSVLVTTYFSLDTTSTGQAWNISPTGTLQVGNADTAGLLSGGSVANSGQLVFDRMDAASQSAPITGSGTLTQLGTGTTTLTAAANYSGPTIISGGVLNFSGGVAHSIGKVTGVGTLQVDASATLLSDGVNLLNGTWTINGTQTIRSSASNGAYGAYAAGNGTLTLSGTSEVTNLSFGGSGHLNLMNNALIVEATPATKATLLAQISLDISSGAITSSTAASNAAYALVEADNADLSASYFGGIQVDANSIIITQALIGDANLDGAVTPADLLIWANNFNKSGSYSVGAGDFNSDGSVTPADLLLWANNFNNSIGANGVPSIASGGSLGTGGGLTAPGGGAATPEPASLAILGLGVMGLLMRRRPNVALEVLGPSPWAHSNN